MRILYGITHYLPHISGLTRCLKPISEHQHAAGNDVTIIAAQSQKSLATEEKIGGVKVVRVPVSFWVGKGPVMLGHVLRVNAALRTADLLHLFLPQFDAGLAAWVARLKGRKVVLTYVCSFTSPGLRGLVSMGAAQVSHFLAGLAAHRIVALSEDYARQSRFCRIFARKLSFIPIPVPDYPARALPRRAPEAPYRIGFVGRISAEKNIGLLLDALPLLREALGAGFTLELVGPRDNVAAAPQIALMERLENEKSVELKLLGQLSESALDEFYRGIDVLVLPSVDRIEAYGLVQVEAMLRGTPCVTSDRPGMREPITITGFGALFRPGDAQDLTRALVTVLRQDMDVAPEMIHDAFNPARINAEYSRLYAELLDDPRPKAR